MRKLWFLVIFILFSGCYVGVEDAPYIRGPFVDLEVEWRIEGSESATYCDLFDIAKWEVVVDGPETRMSTIDCRKYWWSSENDFLSLYEGTYKVSISAFDHWDYLVAQKRTITHLVDMGYVNKMVFYFGPLDFY